MSKVIGFYSKGKGRYRKIIPITEVVGKKKQIKFKEFLREQNGFKIMFVDGQYVRDKLSIDFTMGGHHWVYGFIPKNEIWIDKSLTEKDVEATIAHELAEAPKMRKGMSYGKAHEKANKVEEQYRRVDE